MKKLVALTVIISCICCRGFTQENFYSVFTGKLMGADAVAHLHVSGGKISGYLHLVKDPRPMSIAVESSTWKKDSVAIYGFRGPDISLNIRGVLAGGQIKGTAELIQDEKKIRNGEVLLMEDKTNYTPCQYFSTSGRTTLPANLKNESDCAFSAATIWPVKTDNSAAANFVRNTFYKSFSVTAGKEPSAALPAKQQKFLTDWKNQYIKMGVKETENLGMSISAEEITTLMVLSEGKMFLNLALYGYSFTGGAHGNYATTLFSFDKRSNKVLALSDVLTPAGISALPALLSKAARAQYGVPANQGLQQAGFNANVLPVTKNFWAEDGGLGFSYTPYEIGPYSMGEVVLFLPMASLSSYLQPSFRVPSGKRQ